MLFLIVLNLFWSIAALLYDLPALASIPTWALPFIIICPLYPLLLALAWWKPTPAWISLAALPSSVYGVLALIFYPLVMHYEGFSWSALLQIPWVLVYGIQGWYLLSAKGQQFPLLLITGLFLTASFIIQYKTQTFGYLGVESLPKPDQLGLVATAIFITWIFIYLKRPVTSAETLS